MEGWTTAYRRYIHEPYIEYELRLGKQKRSGFDPNVGETAFNKVLSVLDSYDGWVSVQRTSSVDYYYGNNIRVSKPSNECIEKCKLYSSNLKLSKNIHVRCAVSRETPATEPVNAVSEYVRKKLRVRYNMKFFAIDMTRTEDTYEIEVEITDINYARAHSGEFVVGSMMNEISNIINCSNI